MRVVSMAVTIACLGGATSCALVPVQNNLGDSHAADALASHPLDPVRVRQERGG